MLAVGSGRSQVTQAKGPAACVCQDASRACFYRTWGPGKLTLSAPPR